MRTRVYFRFVENIVGTEQRVSMSKVRTMPRYAVMDGERHDTGKWSLPLYPMYLADYIWYYENGKIKYMKNRYEQPIMDEELTVAHLSAVEWRR